MTNKKLELLVRNARAFFADLKGQDLQDLSGVKVADPIWSTTD